MHGLPLEFEASTHGLAVGGQALGCRDCEQRLVHLGEGVFWTDEIKPDKWDTPNSEERAAENELPALDTPQQLADLAFAWRVARHVKSNAIVYVKDEATVGVGAGQIKAGAICRGERIEKYNRLLWIEDKLGYGCYVGNPFRNGF